MSPLTKPRSLPFAIRLLAALVLLLQGLPAAAECGAAPCGGAGRLIGAFTEAGAPVGDDGCCGGTKNARSCETQGCRASSSFLARSAGRIDTASRQVPPPTVACVEFDHRAGIDPPRRGGHPHSFASPHAPPFLKYRSLLC
jgi:hypothetical protein